MRVRLPILVVAALAGLATPAQAQYVELRGALHEHSAYSDGWPGTRPADYFASGRAYGLDFMGSSEHSTNMGLPVTFSEACIAEALAPQCAAPDGASSLRKWEATQEQADAASDASFVGMRGFEWTSDRFGHINVYLSQNWTNEATSAAHLSMEPFWRWFTTAPALGGGSDGLGTFNHPGAKKLDGGAALNWNRFRYVPEADERMVGIEVFNDDDEYGSDGGHAAEGGAYAFALDRGWHVGAAGAEDLGHRRPPLDDWGGPAWPKTVILATARTREAIREALLARRFYAVAGRENALRLSFTVNGRPMGSRLVQAPNRPVALAASVSDPALTLELVTRAGKVVASATGGMLKAARRPSAEEPWFFVRARRGSRIVAYSSPVWVERAAVSGEWLAGDGHVHTCFSHDAYCPETDPPEDAETFYSSFGTVLQRFTEAAAKGLDYLVVSDHDDTRAWSDPAFGSQGVVGVKAYEWSLSGGHAQMLGARRDYGDGDPGTVAGALNADGGLFQANHPSYRAGALPATCDEAMGPGTPLHWRQGFSVRPDAIEVWNPTALIPPGELFWECWLQRGVRIPVTAGSDSHGGTQPTLGLPTTWVLARDRRQTSILEAIGLGRTTLSRLPPALGGARLVLEADRDRDGTYESMMGDAVPPGTPMRVRGDGLTTPGQVRVRANGATLLDGEPLAPGGEIAFAAPREPGWVRAVLYQEQRSADVDPFCRPPASSESPIVLCTADLAVSAVTSPVYLEVPGTSVPSGTGTLPTAPATTTTADEPDDDPALPPALQSAQGAALPEIPAGGPLATRRADLGAVRLRLRGRRATWSSAAPRHDVQVRRGRRWRTVAQSSPTGSVRVGRRVRAVRVRARAADGRSGAWAMRRR